MSKAETLSCSVVSVSLECQCVEVSVFVYAKHYKGNFLTVRQEVFLLGSHESVVTVYLAYLS